MLDNNEFGSGWLRLGFGSKFHLYFIAILRLPLPLPQSLDIRYNILEMASTRTVFTLKKMSAHILQKLALDE